MINYDEMQIDDLLKAVRNGDDDACGALLRRYAPLVDSMVYKTMPLISSAKRTDEEELRQEATIKLYQAALAYDPDQSETSFGLYAKICIKNRMISLVRRQVGSDVEIDTDVVDNISESETFDDPLEVVVDREREFELDLKVKSVLSALEYEVYDLHMDGASIKQISETLHISEKTVENALYRMKIKLQKLFFN